MKKEIWKNVLGFENIYQVSNYGRVKSLKWNKEIIMNPAISKKGYCRVHFRKNGISSQLFLHRIILETFIGNSNLQCNHKNGIKIDNRLENLEWVTQSKNTKHAYDNNLIPDRKGENNSNCKTSKNIVIRLKWIKKYINPEMEYWYKIARAMKVKKSFIYDVVNERCWKHIQV